GMTIPKRWKRFYHDVIFMLIELPKNIKALLFEFLIAPVIQYRQPYHVIDKHIKAAVQQLNAIDGVETIASCHGHWCGRTEPPYVYFKAPVHIAIHLHQHLWSVTQFKSIPWVIEGKFNQECELCFRLTSPIYDKAYHYFLSRLWRYGYQRRELEQSMRNLADEIEVARRELLVRAPYTAKQ
ncbi:hypothetical protein, partial [Vibrio harveyi]